MSLNLSEAQIKKLMKGNTVQISNEDLEGGSIDFGRFLKSKKVRKIAKAIRDGKGMRLDFDRDEGEKVGGMIDAEDEIEGGGFFKKLKKSVKKTGNTVSKVTAPARKVVKQATKAGNTIEKQAKKHVTEKNVGKYALKGYNRLNEELEKQGMQSVHGAILNEGLGAIPFVPQSVKDVGAHYANREIDRQLAKETERIGAGFRGDMRKAGKKALNKTVRVVKHEANKRADMAKSDITKSVALAKREASVRPARYLNDLKNGNTNSIERDYDTVRRTLNKPAVIEKFAKKTAHRYVNGGGLMDSDDDYSDDEEDYESPIKAIGRKTVKQSGFKTYDDGRDISRPFTSNTQYSNLNQIPFSQGFAGPGDGDSCLCCGHKSGKKSKLVGGSFRVTGGSFRHN